MAEVGVLCEECRDELSSPIKIMPEQLQGHGARPTMSALIDLWGRPHRLDARAIVGRQVETQGIAILEPSVSRHHAHITLDADAWTVKDLGSANGTFIDDKLIEAPTQLHEGDRVRFGQIAFYFIEDVTKLPTPRLGRTATATIRPLDRTSRPQPDAGTAPAPQFARETLHDEEEKTDVGLPTMSFRMHEPTGGGGGLVEVDGKQVQLTTTQFELMALMIKRMAAEIHQPELVRGFVRSSELIADLSWDTREPSENHVKQLVRRVRRALIKSEIGDLIESRHRFGYRLRAIPRPDF
ncbi:MAG: FHA domain-containing protein [Deltaproteobacteria bacterium]|nr:FHA domain-containing protein [Deltaproteobacteria bacterium]